MKLASAMREIERYSGGHGPNTDVTNMVLNLLDELVKKYPKQTASLWKKVVKEYQTEQKEES